MSENKYCIKNMNTIEQYWNNRPCNINHSKKEFCSIEYFDEVETKKHFVESHIINFAEFPKWNKKKVLEIGCGIGTAAVNFCKNGAIYTGIELSNESLKITEKRLTVYNLSGELFNINAENDLAFLGEKSYDLIYSFGVIHHSPNPDKIVNNVLKLLKPGGIFKLMLYAENSWKKMLINKDQEQYEAQNGCPLAYTYTNEQVYNLLKDFKNIKIHQDHIFPYKIDKYKNNIYEKEDWFEHMPENMFKILEEKLGWHLCITCEK
jgi:2-polyprenyl-3-methyl-5-hydroxy-6-metoxy-1,4-benzoquinol methylase